MSADNLVMINGRLARDIDLKYSQGGTAIASFSVAVSRSYKNQQGERETDFINCTAFGKTAENIANYFKKGSMIGIQGEYQNNNYIKDDGTKVYRDHLKVDNFGFRESKNNNQQQNSQQQNNFSNQQTQQNYQQDSMPGLDSRGFNNSSDPFGNSSQIEISDSDIPF